METPSKRVRNILFAQAILFWLLGILTHYLFRIFDYNGVVGLFAPTNESVWEHLKLLLLPYLLVYAITYFALRKKEHLDPKQWFAAMLIGFLAAEASIVVGYYTYVGGFGKDSLTLDLVLFVMASFVAQGVAWNRLKAHFTMPLWQSLGVYALIIVLFGIFTYYPPQIALFWDT
ncbi:MAG: DUF6512 family protein, partial [Erysipelotrichaceae bacterium]